MTKFSVWELEDDYWIHLDDAETEKEIVALADEYSQSTENVIGIKRDYPDPSFIYRVWK
jgi:hypothetical protein